MKCFWYVCFLMTLIYRFISSSAELTEWSEVGKHRQVVEPHHVAGFYLLYVVDRRLHKQNVFCLVDSLSPLHVKLSLDLALSFCFIICLLNKPLFLSASSAFLLFFSCICIVWSAAAHYSVDCASRIYLLYSALRVNQLIFIYFNVAPPCGAWHRQWQLVVFPSASATPEILCITCKFIDPVLQQRWNC